MSSKPLFDPMLVDNGRWCSCCFPDGPPATFIRRHKRHPRAGCNECGGAGRIVFTAEEIVAATVAERRRWEARAA